MEQGESLYNLIILMMKKSQEFPVFHMFQCLDGARNATIDFKCDILSRCSVYLLISKNMLSS